MTQEALDPAASAHEAEAPAKLPIDIPALLIGVRSRRHLLATFAIASLIVGLVGARLLGKKSFEARTVLLYRPPQSGGTMPAGVVEDNDTPTLLTQMDMVKIDDNLEEVRRRLKLKATAEALGKNIKVDVPINSSLMTITATAEDAKKSADIANATRDSFLEQQLNIQHAQAASKIRDLVARQTKVQDELRTAEQNLKDFTIKNHVVDLDKEAGWYLQQLINTELVYEEAVGQDNATKLQEQNIGKIASRLEKKVQDEEAQIDGDPGGSAHEPNASRVTDDAIRGRVANLKMKQIEMDRAKTLADDGIYSKKDYEKAKAAYEQERFMLYKDSPSSALYKEMTLRELDVQLAHISDQQKVAHLREAVAHVHERLDSLPLVQRDYLALQREVAIRAAERERIDLLLGTARRENESQTFGFSVVSIAEPPPLPLKSNGKVVFIALTVLGTGAGFVLALLFELLDRTIRSVGDARAKLSPEVLAGFEHGALDKPALGDESLRLVNRLRRSGVGPGSSVMIVSPTPGEGAPELIQLLAHSFASGGDSVLMVDACFRDIKTDAPLVRAYSGWRKRLQDILERLRPEILLPPPRHTEASLTSLADAMDVTGFSDALVHSGRPVSPIMLGTRMRLMPVGQVPSPELLLSNNLPSTFEACVQSQELVFLHTAPLLESPDATFLGATVKTAVLVVSAGKVTAEKISSCAKALQESGVNVLGIVVTNIATVFAERR